MVSSFACQQYPNHRDLCISEWILLCFLQYFTFSYKHGARPPDKLISYSWSYIFPMDQLSSLVIYIDPARRAFFSTKLIRLDEVEWEHDASSLAYVRYRICGSLFPHASAQCQYRCHRAHRRPLHHGPASLLASVNAFLRPHYSSRAWL